MVILAVCACSAQDARWVDTKGNRVPDGQVNVGGEFPLTIGLRSGPSHCDWQNVQFLDVVWPIGEVVTGHSDAIRQAIRQYVWDPAAAHGFDLAGTLQRDAAPPADATDTGYRHGRVELWFADSDADRYAYLRQSDGSFERWPRSSRLNWCK